MSTWYSAGISFYSKDKELLSDFKQRLDNVYDKNRKFILEEVNLEALVDAFYPVRRKISFDCNGTFSMDEGIESIEQYFFFRLLVTTVHGLKLQIFISILKDFYPNIKMAYICDEPIYFKWDEDKLFYPFKYYVDICVPSKSGELVQTDEHEFSSMDEIRAWLSENTNCPFRQEGSLFELEESVQNWIDDDECWCILEEFMDVRPEDV